MALVGSEMKSWTIRPRMREGEMETWIKLTIERFEGSRVQPDRYAGNFPESSRRILEAEITQDEFEKIRTALLEYWKL